MFQMMYNGKERRMAEGAAYELISPPQGVSTILFPTCVFQHLVQFSFQSSQTRSLLPHLFSSSSNRIQTPLPGLSLSAIVQFYFMSPGIRDAHLQTRCCRRSEGSTWGIVSQGESFLCDLPAQPSAEPLICSHFHIRHENVLLCLTAALAQPCFH